MSSFSLLSTFPSLVDSLGHTIKHANSCTCKSPAPQVPKASRFFYIPCLGTSTQLSSIVKKNDASAVLGVLVRHKPSTQIASFESSAMEAAANAGLWPAQANEWSSLQASDLTTTHTPASALNTFALSGLRSIFSLPSPCASFTFHILEKAPVTFPPLSQPHKVSFASLPGGSAGSANIPTRECWDELWRTWDLITLGMIPKEMLLQKPIQLRHKCLFYIGHIPTFLDMMLCHTLGGEASEPQYFWKIFERGIDPHVDDPDHCHNHSDVPQADEDWPTLETIMGFRDRVRKRLNTLYDELDSGERAINLAIARTLVMTYEHESLHVETILYMLIQRAGTGTRPPPGFTAPLWNHLKAQWNTTTSHLQSNTLPLPVLGPTTLSLGHDDSEADDHDAAGVMVEHPSQVVDREFGWDNESPKRGVSVGKFRAEWNPVSNGEFEAFWRAQEGKVPLPASWVLEGEQVKVRTVYGPVSMEIAQHWPVMTSYDNLLRYAESKGGRLPTEPELRLFLDTYDVQYDGGANVGFRNWHPVPPSMGLRGTDGKGSNGGVWEWTSTHFDNHDGLFPTKLFVGYSTDFFDGVHHIVLGASYATLPRLGRRTLRNFYQHNYPYPWVGARVVYDVE